MRILKKSKSRSKSRSKNLDYAYACEKVRKIRMSLKLHNTVDEITFHGPSALEKGQYVFYITNVDAFRLARKSLELICVVPGIDIARDILEPTRHGIVLPESGEVPVADTSIMTGDGFNLVLNK